MPEEDQISRFERFTTRMEALRIAEYIDTWGHPWQIIWRNFVAGMARGFGVAVGMTIVVAVAAFLLARAIDIPVIGAFIAQIVEVVQEYLTLGTLIPGSPSIIP